MTNLQAPCRVCQEWVEYDSRSDLWINPRTGELHTCPLGVYREVDTTPPNASIDPVEFYEL